MRDARGAELCEGLSPSPNFELKTFGIITCMQLSLLMASILSQFCCIALLLVSFSLNPPRVEGSRYQHVVGVESLLPGTVCSSPTVSSPSTVKIVHWHGPCSPASHHRSASHAHILRQDQVRVDSLHRRIHRSQAVGTSLVASIPSRTGIPLDSGNYLVTLGFGTPKQDMTVGIDTGSDLTWLQCKFCTRCYPQTGPLYDPARSQTSKNISCTSQDCTQLDSHSCSSSSTCRYQVLYGDNSTSNGTMLSDTLSLTPSPFDVLPGFKFGCGDTNSPGFGQTAGLLGLGRKPVSLVSQSAQKYDQVFSYCLPSSESTGRLRLGRAHLPSVSYTPMLDGSVASFYYVKLLGINVGGTQLPVSAAVFASPGTIMDSGTVITRLPRSAYAALRAEFEKQVAMFNYPKAPKLEILDTCYDMRGRQTVTVPSITFLFDNNVELDVDFTGILYVASLSQACLAFAQNDRADDVTTIGNVQQQRFNVVYDVKNKQIGFGSKGC